MAYVHIMGYNVPLSITHSDNADDGRTHPAGKPVCCGGFAQALSSGNYTFEVVIDDAVVASVTDLPPFLFSSLT